MQFTPPASSPSTQYYNAPGGASSRIERRANIPPYILSLSFVSSYLTFFSSPPTVTLEAASARMAARDRFGVYAEPGLTPLQRAIRELNPRH